MALKNFIILALIFFILSCGDSKRNDVLMQPPYRTLTDSIKRDKTAPELYYRRGILLFQRAQTNLAESDLKKAWQLQKNEKYALGLVEILEGRDKKAATQFNLQAIQEVPQSISLKVALIKAYIQQGNLKEALITCNQLLQKYPAQIDALLLKWQLLKSLTKKEEAMATLERAYSYAPFDAELAHSLAFEYAEAKNSKVLTLSDSLIKADSLKIHAEPYYFKGVYYTNIGNASEAVKQFDAAIQHDYNFMNAYINKGIVYYDEKKYGDALKTFGLTTSIFPTQGDGYYWLGKTQEAAGNKTEAKLNYQRAYGLDKTLMEAKEAAEKL